MPLTPKYDYASVGGPGVVPLQGDASGNNCGPITAANPMPVSMAGSTGVNSATVQGTSAALAADNADFPVMTGGYASATAPFSATTGQKTKFWTSLNGASVMAGFSVNGADGMSNGGQAALLLSAGGVSNGLVTNGYFYNGTTWDRARGDTSGQYVAGVISPSAASGVTRAVTGAVASALVIKASAGNLGRVGIATGANAGYLMLFNATTAPADGAVTPVSAYTVAANSTLEMDYSGAALQFATGMVAVFSTTGPFTKTASATAMIWADAK
jgi:hypothetical protein